mgnify:CR=1 FL=1
MGATAAAPQQDHHHTHAGMDAATAAATATTEDVVMRGATNDSTRPRNSRIPPEVVARLEELYVVSGLRCLCVVFFFFECFCC